MTIRPRDNFSYTIGKAGIERRQLAEAAGVSKRAIDRLAKPENYTKGERDKGGTRVVTAWRIARAFSKLAGLTDDDAFSALFIEE